MGSEPMSAAIAASEVAITVASMFSMNSATARTSGTTRAFTSGDRLGLEQRLHAMPRDIGACVGRQAQERERADRGNRRHGEPCNVEIGEIEWSPAHPGRGLEHTAGHGDP